MADLLVVALLLAAAATAWRLAADLRVVPDAAIGTTAPPAVSVVVPARDEARTLPALLGSLRDSGTGVAEVVVVDDASEDATSQVARDAGARVLDPGPPPAGWTGKAWACHVGARAARGELLLFLDADTVLAPRALAGLVALHRRHGGLVSVQPFHRVVRPHEQLSAYFNVVAVLASGAFRRRPAVPPMAFGPCLLTSREDYERAGGHAAVRAEILDDVRLAHAYHDAGLPVRSFLGGGCVSMRSYPDGLRQLAAGWTKNVASGARAAAPAPALGTVLWVSAHHAVAVGAGAAAVAAVAGWAVPLAYGGTGLWLLAWAGLAGQLRSMLHRIGSFRWWTWALFPLPLLAFDVLFLRSAARTALRRSVQWRGRSVDVGRRRPSERRV